ncbi:carbohydrate ABC transporter permease [Vagococcus carniphilus]|uniref:carbohydrate ABC transporter permease n=1 Tax=Vagococcus carniphilus TaxID=218144 RepID=UPI00288F6939|nr:carbohydrate ABC transporter permease [Vagococcus carniphilus]MDT2813715.1 carbohydrate ABC transporter permease [Vagococcus carniphilus]MDT2848735.1 carbohydrate ABC transporter permease [Vagococcus carniphilus]
MKCSIVKKLYMYILLFSISILLLGPLLWMLSTSLKSMQEIVSFPPTIIPQKIQWHNYIDAITSFPFFRYMGNTFIITILVIIGTILSNSFIAYGFSKIDFPLKNLFFSLVLSTMMIPSFITMIPQYIVFSKIGWVGTYLPLIVPSFFGNAFHIFLLRQFYLSISNELVDAAKIDGANHFYIWFKLMIPLTKPALITIGILSFNGTWNDFIGPLLYIHDEAKYTLQIGLQVFQNQSTTQWNLLMASAFLTLVPTILLFFFAQKYFIKGMDLTGGMKG